MKIICLERMLLCQIYFTRHSLDFFLIDWQTMCLIEDQSKSLKIWSTCCVKRARTRHSLQMEWHIETPSKFKNIFARPI